MKICVVGLGKLGAPLAGFLSSLHEVVGIDHDPRIEAMVRAGMPPVPEPGLDKLMYFDATTDYAAAAEAEIIFIVVPTPSLEDGAFSLEHVANAVSALRPFLTPQHLLVIVSTVMPGHTETLVHDLPCGVCYNPSFIALGSVIHNLKYPDLLLVGRQDPKDAHRLALFWRSMGVQAPLREMDYRSAEIAKLALNCFVTMKISFANTLGEVCEFMGADAKLVTKAIALDRRVGPHYLTPAAPYGGPCFPRDNRAFSKMARDAYTAAELAEATDRVNQWQQMRLVLGVICKAHGKPATVAVLGLAYKTNTPVTEESAGKKLVEYLRRNYAGQYTVLAHDPMAEGGEDLDAQEVVDRADVVVITTPWRGYMNLDYSGKEVIDPWRIAT